ncbi:MAG: hypothetical protein P1U34_01740 [Coxiellaceae bacterium]|nr:hypothetical protein [Coxiellaceae bacterium]
MTRILNRFVSVDMADGFWREMLRYGDELQFLSWEELKAHFPGCEDPKVIMQLLAVYLENYPTHFQDQLLLSFKYQLDRWLDADLYVLLRANLAPTNRAFFSGFPANTAEWCLLHENLYPFMADLLFRAVTKADDGVFDTATALPFFNPYAYRSGVHDYLSEINACTKLSAEQKKVRCERIMALQEARSLEAGDKCLSVHMSRQPFGCADLVGFANSLREDEPMPLVEETVPGCNAEVVNRFFTLTAWLTSHGFEAIAEKLNANTYIRQPGVFEQITFRLEIFCANTWSALSDPVCVETIHSASGEAVTVLQGRDNFNNPAIIDQIENCAEGVEQAFIDLESFLNISFQQKLFSEVKKQVLLAFHQQYGTPTGLQVHVDDAMLHASLGLYTPQAYKSDPFRLPISPSYLQALGHKILVDYRTALIAQYANVSNLCDQFSPKKALTCDVSSTTLLMRLSDALSEVGVMLTPVQLLQRLVDVEGVEAWCEEANTLFPSDTSDEATNLMIIAGKLTELKAEVRQQFKSMVVESDEVSFGKSLFGFETEMIDILASDAMPDEKQKKIISHVLAAPDGLYFIKNIIESMQREGTAIVANKLLYVAANGESIYTAFAKHAELSQWFVGVHLQINDAEMYEMSLSEAGPSCIYDGLASIASYEPPAEEKADVTEAIQAREYHHQAEMLLTATGTTNYWLFHLARDGRYDSTGDLLDQLLQYLSIDGTQPYKYDSFMDLLIEFGGGNLANQTLVTSFIEQRLEIQAEAGDFEAYLATAVLLPDQALSREIFEAIISSDVLIQQDRSVCHFIELVDRSDISIIHDAAKKAEEWKRNLGDEITPMQRDALSYLTQVTSDTLNIESIRGLILRHSAFCDGDAEELINDIVELSAKLKCILSDEGCLRLCESFAGEAPYISIIFSELVCRDESHLKATISDMMSDDKVFYKIKYFNDLILTITSLAKVLGEESSDIIKKTITHEIVREFIHDGVQLLYLIYVLAKSLPRDANENIELLIAWVKPSRFVSSETDFQQFLSQLVGAREILAGADPVFVVITLLKALDLSIIHKGFDCLYGNIVAILKAFGDGSKPILQMLLNPRELPLDIKRKFDLIAIVDILYTTLGNDSSQIIKDLLLDNDIFSNAFVVHFCGFDEFVKTIVKLPWLLGDEAKETALALMQLAISQHNIVSLRNCQVLFSKICLTYMHDAPGMIDALLPVIIEKMEVISLDNIYCINRMLVILFKAEASHHIKSFLSLPKIRVKFESAEFRVRLRPHLSALLTGGEIGVIDLDELFCDDRADDIAVLGWPVCFFTDTRPPVEVSKPGDGEEKPGARRT